MRTRRIKNGFTLVEIIVVLGIIGVLTSILTANFMQARQDARNKTMRTELREVQLALELYRAQNKQYPPTGGSYPTNLKNVLVPEYIPDLPDATDSRNANCTLTYTADVAGTYYKLTAARCVEGVAAAATGVQIDDEFARCPSFCGTCTSNSYVQTDPQFYESLAVYSAGGQCQ
ncbi:MAG: type II secretion system protein [Patescibacteria group bacterium]